ncbi:CYTH domain-containing protein [Mycena indigotica]|uniref:CYTH domain-containing protein n=1 Tax=Mycena indigotica TaxID=2126181 RepID=A0A8H6W4A1_9AGAR|nr:CYTH domain-containing protein [Mycena indigotica]KAF7301218.1 CYTH domain-containing protein [Mycena indigotica]
MLTAQRLASVLLSKIEIERKFIPTRAFLDALKRQTKPATIQFIRDVYYDGNDSRLTLGGLWVRRRTVLDAGASSPRSSWEAKVRVGGDRVASQFLEVEGPQAVEREIQRVLGERNVTIDAIHEHLEVMCDLTTRRLSSPLPLDLFPAPTTLPLEQLTVAIDQAVETKSGDFSAACGVLERPPQGFREREFFHEIGELELMEQVRTNATEDDHEARRKVVAEERAAQLDAFINGYPALFPKTPTPQGKLNAYFAWLERHR